MGPRDKLRSLYITGPIFFEDDFPMTLIKLGSQLTTFIGCFLLLAVIVYTRSTIRLSRQTQCIYLMVTVAQALSRVPWKLLDYQLIHPSLFFLSHFLILYVVSVHQKYGKHDDNFRSKPLVLATALLALISTYSGATISIQTFFHSWGLYLEAIAMLPQLGWLARSKVRSNVNTKVLHAYVNIEAVAKILSITHWVYLYRGRKEYDHLAVKCELFQVTCHVLFLGFMVLRRQGMSCWRNTGDTLLVKS